MTFADGLRLTEDLALGAGVATATAGCDDRGSEPEGMVVLVLTTPRFDGCMQFKIGQRQSFSIPMTLNATTGPPSPNAGNGASHGASYGEKSTPH